MGSICALEGVGVLGHLPSQLRGMDQVHFAVQVAGLANFEEGLEVAHGEDQPADGLVVADGPEAGILELMADLLEVRLEAGVVAGVLHEAELERVLVLLMAYKLQEGIVGDDPVAAERHHSGLDILVDEATGLSGENDMVGVFFEPFDQFVVFLAGDVDVAVVVALLQGLRIVEDLEVGVDVLAPISIAFVDVHLRGLWNFGLLNIGSVEADVLVAGLLIVGNVRLMGL